MTWWQALKTAKRRVIAVTHLVEKLVDVIADFGEEWGEEEKKSVPPVKPGEADRKPLAVVQPSRAASVEDPGGQKVQPVGKPPTRMSPNE